MDTQALRKLTYLFQAGQNNFQNLIVIDSQLNSIIMNYFTI